MKRTFSVSVLSAAMVLSIVNVASGQTAGAGQATAGSSMPAARGGAAGASNVGGGAGRGTSAAGAVSPRSNTIQIPDTTRLRMQRDQLALALTQLAVVRKTYPSVDAATFDQLQSQLTAAQAAQTEASLMESLAAAERQTTTALRQLNGADRTQMDALYRQLMNTRAAGNVRGGVAGVTASRTTSDGFAAASVAGGVGRAGTAAGGRGGSADMARATYSGGQGATAGGAARAGFGAGTVAGGRGASNSDAFAAGTLSGRGVSAGTTAERAALNATLQARTAFSADTVNRAAFERSRSAFSAAAASINPTDAVGRDALSKANSAFENASRVSRDTRPDTASIRNARAQFDDARRALTSMAAADANRASYIDGAPGYGGGRGGASAGYVDGSPVSSAFGRVTARSSSPPPVPTGAFGFALKCTDCGWVEETGSAATPRSNNPLSGSPSRWSFGSAPEVVQVDNEGVAAKAGVKSGDKIVAINGFEVTTAAAGRALASAKPGTTLKFAFLRGGSRINTSITATTRASGASMQPVRYSGTVNGTPVEVRGDGGVVVTKDPTGSGMTISANGVTVRIGPPKK